MKRRACGTKATGQWRRASGRQYDSVLFIRNERGGGVWETLVCMWSTKVGMWNGAKRLGVVSRIN